ncbi:hypothetical protein ACFWMJ_30770 [Streptomyces hawaiiensis]|uniref:hypothetical protein n=1 Tax=Streptomyces hawaiiensis TaxID=67305 RepID=UPI00365996F3
MSDAHVRTRCRVVGVALLAVGWVVVGLALWSAYGVPSVVYSGAPVCDGKVMGPGDACLGFGPGALDGTYEEIVDRGVRRAKARAWHDAEVTGFVGAVLVTAGAATAAVGGRMRAPAGIGLALCAGTVPMLGAAAALWPLQARADAVSPVPVSRLSGVWPWPGVPSAAVLTVLLAALATTVLLCAAWSTPPEGGAPAPDPQEIDARRKAAAESFEKGTTDDPWVARRISAPFPAHYPVGIAHAVQALGVLCFLTGCALSLADRWAGRDVPGGLAGPVVLLAGALFAAHGLRFGDHGPVRWGYAVAAVPALAAAVSESASLSAVTWAGLVNTLAMWGGFWTLAWWFGATLPRAPLAGRVVLTMVGATSLMVAGEIAVAATAPASWGVSEFTAHLGWVALTGLALVSFDHASKTAAGGGVPVLVSVACLGVSALVLAGSAGRLVLAEAGWAALVMAGITAVTSSAQMYGACRLLAAGARPSEPA